MRNGRYAEAEEVYREDLKRVARQRLVAFRLGGESPLAEQECGRSQSGESEIPKDLG